MAETVTRMAMQGSMVWRYQQISDPKIIQSSVLVRSCDGLIPVRLCTMRALLRLDALRSRTYPWAVANSVRFTRVLKSSSSSVPVVIVPMYTIQIGCQ